MAGRGPRFAARPCFQIDFVQERRIDIAHGNGGQRTVGGVECFTQERRVGGCCFCEGLTLRQIQRIAFGNDRTILWGRSIKKINVCSMQARNQLDGIIGTRRIAARTDGHQRIGLRKGGIVLWGNAHATGKRQHNGLQTAQIGCNGCDAAGRAKRQVTPSTRQAKPPGVPALIFATGRGLVSCPRQR